MTLIEINASNDPFHRLVDRGIVKNDVGRFAAQLERQLLLCAGKSRRDLFADFSRTGERNLIDIRMINEDTAGLSRASNDVDDAVRKLRFLQNLGQM